MVVVVTPPSFPWASQESEMTNFQSKEGERSPGNHFCLKHTSLNIGTLSQAFIWLMKSQTAGDIYPAKWRWLRRKRLYPAFFSPLTLLYEGVNTNVCTKRIACLWTSEPDSGIVAIALDDGNYFVFPWVFSLLACSPSSLLDTRQQPIIKVFSGGSISMYYPL